MKRVYQCVLIGSTIVASWFGMQAIHECGHVLGAILTGAEIKRVVLHPLSISRTDIGLNPHPLVVIWSGPLFGVVFPDRLWRAVAAMRLPGSFVFRFFSGFCWIANGAYIAVGSFERVGDCGEMLAQGTKVWMLWMFGAVTIPIGLRTWDGQGTDFGLGAATGEVDHRVALITFAVCLVLIGFGLFMGES